MLRPLLALLLLACSAPAAQDAAERPPNLLLILADDMGYGDPVCFQAESAIPTPHLDRLASEGVRFTDAHSPGSVCVPTRYGLMTGRYPCRERRFPVGRGSVIEAERLTLPGHLRAAGYATAMVGKWHLGFDGGPLPTSAELRGGPLDRGFEHFFGMHASLDIPPYYYVRGRAPVAPPNETIEASGTEGWTNIQGAFWRGGPVAPGFVHAEVHGRFEQGALAYLDERAEQEQPFFLYLALASPHTPWLPSEEFAGTTPVDLYGDFVAQVDATVGALLDALERNAQAENTLVIFTSDNGPVWYPADVERFEHAATGPWRGMKGDAWEGGHRMPFLARWPGRAPAGATCAQTLCFTDLLATAADLCGRPLPEGTTEDSHSLLPVLLDPSAATTRTTTVHKADASAIREGRWKLINHLGSGGFSSPRRVEPVEGGPRGQLYDLEADPGETTNLWDEQPEVVERLSAALAAYAED